MGSSSSASEALSPGSWEGQVGEQHPPTQGCPGLSLSQAPEAWGLGEQGHESPGLAPQGVWPGRPWASSSAPLEPSGPSLLGRRRLALGPDSIPCSAFEEEQKRRKQEIVSRLLKEEAVEDRRRPRPEPPRPTGQRSLRDQTWSYVATVCDGQSTEAPPCCPLVSTGPCLPAKISTTESALAPGPFLLVLASDAPPPPPGPWMASRLPPKAGVWQPPR